MPSTRNGACPMRSTSMPAGGWRSPSCCASARPTAIFARSTSRPARPCGIVRSAPPPPWGFFRAPAPAPPHSGGARPPAPPRRNGPFNLPTLLPFTIGTPNNGGAVTTASGLIFIAAATDDLLRAIDERTGKVVWSVPLPAGGQATPIVYQQDGREYLVIFAGGHHFMETPMGDSVIAYALPRGA